MGFRVGFVAGCAVGMWAAVKAAQLQRLGVQPARRWPGSVSSRATPTANPEVTAEKLRALGDLARERVTSLVGDRGTARQDRIAGLLGASLREGPDRASARWPINGNRHSA
jgi:hypothetical protein